MRVLIVSNLDADKPFGQFTRPYYLGRGLRKLGVDVVHVAPNGRDLPDGETAISVGRQSIRALGSGTRSAARRCRPDVVYAHQNMPAAAALAALSDRPIPVVADFHSVPSLEWANVARATSGTTSTRAWRQRVATAAVERGIARTAASLVAAGTDVAAHVQRLRGGAAAVAVVANGFSREMLATDTAEPHLDPYRHQDGSRHFVATIPAGASPSNRQALMFLNRIAEHARAADAGVVFHVIGNEPDASLPALRFHGVVPSIRPWLAGAEACLLPYPAEAALFGGARNKLLEALAVGQRVITTREGLRGLEESAAWPGVLQLSDDPKQFADALVASNGTRTLNESRAAFAARYVWDELAKSLLPVLQATVRT